MITVMCRKVDMLSEVEGRKRQELRSKVISSSSSSSRRFV